MKDLENGNDMRPSYRTHRTQKLVIETLEKLEKLETDDNRELLRQIIESAEEVFKDGP